MLLHQITHPHCQPFTSNKKNFFQKSLCYINHSLSDFSISSKNANKQKVAFEEALNVTHQ